MTLTDDTGTFAIDVPVSWADVNTAPGEHADGSLLPSISASSDFTAFYEGTADGTND